LQHFSRSISFLQTNSVIVNGNSDRQTTDIHSFPRDKFTTGGRGIQELLVKKKLKLQKRSKKGAEKETGWKMRVDF